MDTTVNNAVDTAAAAGAATEPTRGFAFAPEPAPVAQPTAQATEKKGAGAVDAQRSADARGKEPRKDISRQNPADPNQAKVGKAFQKESQRIERQKQQEFEKKLAADPYRKIGFRMANDLITSKGLTPEQALAEIDNRYYEALAERDGISVALARHLYGTQAPSEQMKPTALKAGLAEDIDEETDFESEEEAAAAQAQSIVEELLSMKLPDGFDLEAARNDPEFIELLAENSPKTAVRLYHAEQRAAAATEQAEKAPQVVADQLRARSAVPQSTKATAASGPPDFRRMTPQEFKKYQRDNHLI